MSSLVQRQSERQGIFLVALSPFKRGAGGVKHLPYPLSPSPTLFSVIPGLTGNPGQTNQLLLQPPHRKKLFLFSFNFN